MGSLNAILDTRLVIVDSNNYHISLFYSNTTLVIKESGPRIVEHTLSVKQVLWVEFIEEKYLRLSVLLKQKNRSKLWVINGIIHSMPHEYAAAWTESLMNAAYGDRQRGRRLKLIINPAGGPGKGPAIFENKVKPIFDAAHCILDVTVTKYPRHCYEYCKTMSLAYDAIVLLSGDGLVFETFNALADRKDAMAALELPVVQIPAGSANGLSLSLLGLEDGTDVSAATLNAIKGRRMKIDLCSVTQEGKRIISFMGQAIGMMADIDLGTEGLRWMGDARFMAGFIREVGMNRECPVKLEILTVAKDKKSMLQTYRENKGLTLAGPQRPVKLYEGSQCHTESEGSPVEESEDSEEWMTVTLPLTYVYAGKMPYVSRDLMQFPLALPDDGLIDIVAQEQCSRKRMLMAISGASQGKQYWETSQHYFKAKAYRITPLSKKGNLSIDGEKHPFLPFQVEIHQQMGTTLGHGGWFADFSRSNN